MAGKKQKQVKAGNKLHEKKNQPVVTGRRPPMTVVALVAFLAGFLCGVGFTVYKTGGAPAGQVAQTVPDDTAQTELALEQEVKKNPDNADNWIHLGNIYFDTGRFPKAIDAYERALSLAPNNADVLTDLGVMYRRTDRPEDAVASFDRAIVVDPNHETARFNKGIVLLHDLGDQKGAIAAWEDLVAVNPVAMTPSGMSVDEMVTQMKSQAKTEGKE